EVRRRAVEEGPAVVMLRGEDGVPHAGAPGDAGPVARAVGARIERPGGLVVVGDRQVLAPRQGARAAHQRPRQLEPTLASVAPVHEHSKARLVEPGRHRAGTFRLRCQPVKVRTIVLAARTMSTAVRCGLVLLALVPA